MVFFNLNNHLLVLVTNRVIQTGHPILVLLFVRGLGYPPSVSVQSALDEGHSVRAARKQTRDRLNAFGFSEAFNEVKKLRKPFCA